MAENVGGLAASLVDRDAAEKVVRWIHAEYDAEETNRDYRNALRALGKHVVDGEAETDDNDIPVSLSWIPSSTSSNYDRTQLENYIEMGWFSQREPSDPVPRSTLVSP